MAFKEHREVDVKRHLYLEGDNGPFARLTIQPGADPRVGIGETDSCDNLTWKQEFSAVRLGTFISMLQRLKDEYDNTSEGRQQCNDEDSP